MPQSSSEYPPLDFADKMPFGKHKGDTVAECIDDDVNYMLWLSEEKPGIFTEGVYKELEKYVG